MKQLFVVGAIALAAVGLAGCGGDDNVELTSSQVSLDERNGSGYAGEAMLTTAEDGTIGVAAAIGKDGEPEGTFPAAIHRGTCDEPGEETVQDLGMIEDGTVYGTVDGDLESLTENDHVLLVFQSESERLLVACGEL